MKVSRRRVLWEYIRARARQAAAFLLFSLVFYIVLSLYSLPVRSVLYAAGLCVFLGAILAALDFARFYERHKAVAELIAARSREFSELEPGTLLEKDIALFGQNIAEELLAENSELIARREENRDYYTMWAHQIKTPIFAARLLLEKNSVDKNALLAELLRIEQFSEMVLSHTRLFSGTSDLLIRECSLDGIVRQAVRKFAPVFVRKGLFLDFEESGGSVLTDEKWAVFVVSQAISNAVKYTFRGGVTLRVFSGGGGVKTLVVKDSGCGIPPQDLPRIFERGFTGENGREDKSATGMGLYLSKRIAERLGHGLRAESAPGVGTSIFIEFGRK